MTSPVIAVPRRTAVLLEAGAIRPSAAPRPIAALLRSPPVFVPTAAATPSG